MIELHKILT